MPAPSGQLSVPIDKVRDLVAASTTFQAWIGHPGNSTLAKNRVYAFARPRSGLIWPFAVVGWLPQGWMTRIPTREYNMGIHIYLEFEAKITIHEDPPGQIEPDATYSFTNTIGPVLNEMWVAAGDGTVDRFDLAGMTLLDGPMWENEDLIAGEGNIMFIRFSVDGVTA
jgi:hypothetical protein